MRAAALLTLGGDLGSGLPSLPPGSSPAGVLAYAPGPVSAVAWASEASGEPAASQLPGGLNWVHKV